MLGDWTGLELELSQVIILVKERTYLMSTFLDIYLVEILES